MSSCLCDSCAALCCRYFALPIDNPTTARQYDDIRWYLCHENVCVFIEKKQWYIGISNRCKHLLPDQRCGIYEIRPEVCREYSTDNCDYHGGEYDFEKLFTSAEQLRDYAKIKLDEQAQKRKRKRAKEKRPSAPRRRPLVKANLQRMRQGNGGGPDAVASSVGKNGRSIALPLLGA